MQTDEADSAGYGNSDALVHMMVHGIGHDLDVKYAEREANARCLLQRWEPSAIGAADHFAERQRGRSAEREGDLVDREVVPGVEKQELIAAELQELESR